MDGRMRWVGRMVAILGGVFLAIGSAAGAARAQPGRVEPLKGVETDSLGVAEDAVPVAFERVRGTGQCGIIGHAIVADSASLARLRVFPQCAETVFPPVGEKTLVGLSIFGDCHSSYRFEALRSESRRELRVRVWGRYGGCRAGYHADVWLALPALPPGWSVGITETDVPGHGDDRPYWPDPGWTSLRSLANEEEEG